MPWDLLLLLPLLLLFNVGCFKVKMGSVTQGKLVNKSCSVTIAIKIACLRLTCLFHCSLALRLYGDEYHLNLTLRLSNIVCSLFSSEDH